MERSARETGIGDEMIVVVVDPVYPTKSMLGIVWGRTLSDQKLIRVMTADAKISNYARRSVVPTGAIAPDGWEEQPDQTLRDQLPNILAQAFLRLNTIEKGLEKN